MCSTRNVEVDRSLGADRVIDYTREDFTRTDRRYHLLLEAGTVTPVVERAYALREAAHALRYLGEGHARGKLVVAV